MRHLIRIENIDRWGPNWPLEEKMCFFDPKIWIFGAKSHFFLFWNCNFPTISPVYPGLQLFFFLDHPEKVVYFWGMGHFPGLTISGRCPIASISILNFGSWSTKIGGTVWATKYMCVIYFRFLNTLIID